MPELTQWTKLSQEAPYQYSNQVEVMCEEGYEFQDNEWSGTVATIECLLGGVWNVSRLPNCQRKCSYGVMIPWIVTCDRIGW
mgnify:CR=1 FL=1